VAGVICSYFLITFLALLIFIYLMNTGSLETLGLKTLSFTKFCTLLKVT
jgi:hypothetical protein